MKVSVVLFLAQEEAEGVGGETGSVSAEESPPGGAGEGSKSWQGRLGE